ncbi:hypothetical protein DLM75_12825 [Leptospira stimsonii]|uniref:Uncharacterized protein n=1 Tax=Leptospira stimsonii TaxID=2202203 RepID=A0A396Z6U7_9LEPT|nr:hypothetical protein DLM75_12825 [Leptospira stimsonii]
MEFPIFISNIFSVKFSTISPFLPEGWFSPQKRREESGTVFFILKRSKEEFVLKTGRYCREPGKESFFFLGITVQFAHRF